MIEKLRGELKEFGEQKVEDISVTVKSAKDLCAKLDLTFTHAKEYEIETIYGVPIVESKYMPDNRAVLMDSKGKIVKVFDI